MDGPAAPLLRDFHAHRDHRAARAVCGRERRSPHWGANFSCVR
jgi:hypothetical protein